MKNMYMTPLRYTNFAGVEKNTKLHFHMTPREFADWMIDNKDQADHLVEAFTEVQDQFEGSPDGLASTQQKLTMLKLVRILAELSYGKPDEDGEVFDKSDNAKFIYSAAYDAFRLFLFENGKELINFINTLLNEEVINEFSARMAAIQPPVDTENMQDATPANVPAKKPSEMTREELLSAFQTKNQ